MLDRMYSSKKSLEDILTRKAIKTLIDQYQENLLTRYAKRILHLAECCVQEIFESFKLTLLHEKEVSENFD